MEKEKKTNHAYHTKPHERTYIFRAASCDTRGLLFPAFPALLALTFQIYR